MRLLGVLPSGAVSLLPFDFLFRLLLSLLDSLPFLIMPLVWIFHGPWVRLFATGIASGHRRSVGTRPIVGTSIGTRIVMTHTVWTRFVWARMNCACRPVIPAVASRPTQSLVLLFVCQVSIPSIASLTILRTLNVTPIDTLVACGAVAWRIVCASGGSGRHPVFEVRGPRTGSDRRPTVVHGCSLLAVDASQLAMLILVRYRRKMALASERFLLSCRRAVIPPLPPL